MTAPAPSCQPPDALLVLDISGTMKEKTTAGGVEKTKFEWAKAGISSVMDAPGARGGTIQSEVAFGLSVFPRQAELVNGNLVSGTGRCHMPTAATAIDFATGNKMPIDTYLTGIGTPSGKNDTPIWQALNKAGEMTFPHIDRKRAVVLITDGIQDCCNGPDFDYPGHVPDCSAPLILDPVEAARNRGLIIALVEQLKSQQISVYPVGFGSRVDPLMLGGIAQASATQRTADCDPTAEASETNSLCYYAVDAAGSAGLTEALRQIVGSIQEEVCDGIDNDCDGDIDEDIPPMNCGGPKCGGQGTQTCTMGEWGDCSVPLEPEICDGIDNDCDGLTDQIPCSTDCGPGLKKCIGGVLSEVCEVINPQEELCNNRDDDCDKEIDEPCQCANGETQPCTKNGTCAGVEVCRFGLWSDCEPPRESSEVCDGQDNDCDGLIDGAGATCPDGLLCHRGECVSGIGELGGALDPESFVYRGQGLTRACQAGGSPELFLMLAMLLPLLRRRRG